ncbi:MAG: hypothetical protein Q4G24_06090 [Paracoccus sp. (in: a-proteobacteria)]|uniref:hypothetical protein n=1 Tax=Paracoccus sp. TaxID=267 RepID=UPI0026E01893|nr:hypothetical protein [Paracoccus sp. (in: a-proteobacteria)]MDO5621024.1 hypothetical protein [Paracoccus sp. (in: a-proteobacteria)]
MDLIYLSPVPWDSFAQRPHKFVQWFQRRHGGRVFWVQPYPTRLPQISDFRRLTGPGDRVPAPRPDWLVLLSPRALPVEPLPGSGLVNGRLWRGVLDRLRGLAQSDAMLVIGKPSVLAAQLRAMLPDLPCVYDAMDDFPVFYRGFSRRMMRRREQTVAAAADVIMASSTRLAQAWRMRHGDVRLVPNGLDWSAMTGLPQIAPGTRPVIGYLGTLAAWFDWASLTALAEAAPQAEFRLIGPVFQPAPGPLPGNVTLHPPCPHDRAMAEMARFDIGLIPFLLNPLTASVDPIKYYEYRALRIPVISTAFGEMALRGDAPGVYLLGDPVQVLAQAMAQIGPRQPDQDFGQENDWDARFDAAGL